MAGMKAIAAIAMFVGAALLVLWVAGWIVLIAEAGLREGIRRGLTLWPGNVVCGVMLAVSIVFGVGGFLLLVNKEK